MSAATVGSRSARDRGSASRRRSWPSCAPCWLASEYAYARYVDARSRRPASTPCSVRAKTDAEVQKILKPEWDRQHEALVRRRRSTAGAGSRCWSSSASSSRGSAGCGPPEAMGRRAAAPGTPARAASGQPHAGLAAAAHGGERDAGERLRRLSLPVRAHAAAAPLDLAAVDAILRVDGHAPDSILPVLQAIQSRYRYLPEAALRRVCETSEMTPAQMAGVASFYGQFRLTPAGEHIIRVCEGTACHVSGAVEVRTELRRCLGMTGRRGHRSHRHVHRRARGVHRLLQPGAGHDDRRADLRPPDGAVGRRRPRRVRRARPARAAPTANGARRKAGPGLVLPAPAHGRADRDPHRRRHRAAVASGASRCRPRSKDTVARLRRRRHGQGRRLRGLVPPRAAGRGRRRRAQRVLYGNVDADDVRKLVREHVRPRGLRRARAREAPTTCARG